MLNFTCLMKYLNEFFIDYFIVLCCIDISDKSKSCRLDRETMTSGAHRKRQVANPPKRWCSHRSGTDPSLWGGAVLPCCWGALCIVWGALRTTSTIWTTTPRGGGWALACHLLRRLLQMSPASSTLTGLFSRGPYGLVTSTSFATHVACKLWSYIEVSLTVCF